MLGLQLYTPTLNYFFKHGFGVLNSGPHAHKTSSLRLSYLPSPTGIQLYPHFPNAESDIKRKKSLVRGHTLQGVAKIESTAPQFCAQSRECPEGPPV